MITVWIILYYVTCQIFYFMVCIILYYVIGKKKLFYGLGYFMLLVKVLFYDLVYYILLVQFFMVWTTLCLMWNILPFNSYKYTRLYVFATTVL